MFLSGICFPACSCASTKNLGIGWDIVRRWRRCLEGEDIVASLMEDSLGGKGEDERSELAAGSMRRRRGKIQEESLNC